MCAVLTVAALASGQTAWADANTSTDGVVTVPDIIVKSVIDVSALASWTACDGVSSYTLQLASDDQFTTGSSGGGITTMLIDESFEDNGFPSDWIVSESNISIASGKDGDGYNCVAFKGTGAYLISPLVDNPSNVSFMYKGSSGTNAWSLDVSYSTSIDGPWINIATVSRVDGTWNVFSEDINIVGSVYIKFTDTRASGASTLYIDLIQISGTAGDNVGSGSLIATETVTDGTSYTFTGLTPETTYFARVKGDDDWSNVKEFQTLSVKATHPETWTDVQTALNAASTDSNDPTILILAADITASASNSYLDLPSGRHVILDLYGHTIDRALTEAASNGYVLKVNESSTLTIRDSGTGGTITGGWIDYGTASCISFQGQTLRLEGGSISGNRSNHFGGAIAFKNDFYMTGGTITGNWSNLAGDYGSNMCGQVFFTNKGDFYLSGGAITGNRCGNTTAGSAGIGLNNASSTSRTVHLSGTYTLSGNEQGNYNSATGEWTDISASDILNSGYITYVIDDVITPAPSASPSAMILNTADGGTKASFTSGWATYMGDADPETCFVLSAADTKPGREIDILGGEVSVGLFYIDAQGEKTVHGGDHTAIASGAFTYLGTNNQTTWYYVNGNISSDDYIDLRGDVNLVLADGCRFNGKSFFIDQSLSIYAQSTGDDMGRFTTEGEYELDSGKSLNIHGGRVYLCCSGSATPLFEVFSGNLNITGGRVTLDCTENTLFRPYNKDNCVTIGWHVPGDYIQLQSCDNINPEVSIAIRNGQAMTDGTTTYTGLLTSDQVCDLRDKTLQPCYLVCENSGITNAIAGVIAGNTVAFSRTFSAGKASTICLPFPMTNINGGKVYEFMDVTYDAQDGWVATMIDATPNRVTSTVAHRPYLFLPESDGEVTFSGTVTSVPASVVAGESTSGDWTFHGTYSRKDYGDEGFSGTVFGFAGTSGKATDGVTDVEAGQFVKAGSDAYILPFRAYLTYAGSNSALKAPGRGFEETPAIPDRIKVRLLGSDGGTTATGIINMNTGEITIDQWYYLNGQPVNGAPTAPGLYLNSDGKKVMLTE